jgi:hypothetical protein
MGSGHGPHLTRQQLLPILVAGELHAAALTPDVGRRNRSGAAKEVRCGERQMPADNGGLTAVGFEILRPGDRSWPQPGTNIGFRYGRCPASQSSGTVANR